MRGSLEGAGSSASISSVHGQVPKKPWMNAGANGSSASSIGLGANSAGSRSDLAHGSVQSLGRASKGSKEGSKEKEGKEGKKEKEGKKLRRASETHSQSQSQARSSRSEGTSGSAHANGDRDGELLTSGPYGSVGGVWCEP